MADFNPAYTKTFNEEVVYVNLKSGTNGEVLWGVSRDIWGQSPLLQEFWQNLDFYKDSLDFNESSKQAYKINEMCKNNAVMLKAIKDFYRKEFWYKIEGDRLIDQRVAENFFDFYVHIGDNAIKAVQKAVNVGVDGIVGPITLEAINSIYSFNARLSEVRLGYYNSLNRPEAIKGWTNRIKRFT